LTVSTSAPIAIIGGGIGGVAAAVALHRRGIRATVFERAERIQEVGAGMMLWPNATHVLKELGLLDQVAAASGRNTTFLVRASSGEILMDIATGCFEVPALCTRRSDLLAALLNSLPDGAVRLGHELTGIESSGAGVRVHFANGNKTDARALIGADGIRSRVRAHLFGASAPIYRGYTVFRGIADYAGSALPLGSSSETWGQGKRFGMLETGGGRLTWYASANVPADHVDDPGGRKVELLRWFGGWHEPIAGLIEATPPDRILKNGAYDLAPLSHWGRGRITLLGDAAHPCTPNLGQGGCMALEDALTLARFLAHAHSIEHALRRYESARRRRTKRIQRRSLWMGHIGQWENRLLVAGRRYVTGILPAAIFEHNLRRVYAHQA
jgi:2-polyprenyl-6-methoxyphenol hydroxylase-like FAD-dependent oxidoreductase